MRVSSSKPSSSKIRPYGALSVLLLWTFSGAGGFAEEGSKIQIDLRAGMEREALVRLGPDPMQGRPLVARIVPGQHGAPWPSVEDLSVEVVEEGDVWGAGAPDDEPRLVGKLLDQAGGRSLRLRARAGRCATPDRYRGTVEIWTTVLGEEPASLLTQVPLVVEVAESDAGCAVARTGPWFAVALTGLFLLYPLGMCLNSHCLSKAELIQRIVPVYRDPNGVWKEDLERRGAVREAIEKQLTFFRRACRWALSSPLRFGLLGGTYEETVEIELGKGRNAHQVWLELRPEQKIEKRFLADAHWQEGKLFAVATSQGLRFLGRPHNQRLCGFVPSRVPRGIVWDGEVELEPDLETSSDFLGRVCGWKIRAPRGRRGGGG